MSKIKILTFSN